MLSEHLEKLAAFTGSVQAGSIRRYAQKRGISQSAVSKSLQILESELESPLLLRSREGLKLTPAGQEIYQFAIDLLQRAADVEESVRSEGSLKLKGSLTLGTYMSIAVYFIPRFLKYIREQQADLRVNLLTADSRELIQNLVSGVVDLAISIDPPKRADLFQEVLMNDRYSLYRPTGTSQSLAKSLLFTVPHATDGRGRTILSYLEKQEIRPTLSSCSNFESVRALVEGGVGYALLPDRVAKAGLLAGKIERVMSHRSLVAFGEHHIVFSCRKIRAGDKSIRWVHLQLRAMLQEEPRSA